MLSRWVTREVLIPINPVIVDAAGSHGYCQPWQLSPSEMAFGDEYTELTDGVEL